jgi:hypothetical protein
MDAPGYKGLKGRPVGKTGNTATVRAPPHQAGRPAVRVYAVGWIT